MRSVRRLSVLGMVLLALGTLVTIAQPALSTVATFAPPNLPEGIALDRLGTIYVSMAPTGEIRRIAPDGQQATLASVRVGEGLLVGLTTDAIGNVYAALASGDTPGTETQGVWRIRPSGTADLVAALPGGFPNDLKFDAAGRLFVSDSVLGAIWRIEPDGRVSRWLAHPLLRGQGEGVGPVCPDVNAPFPIGANGLAFAPTGELLVANTEFGRVVRVPVLADGRAGVPEVVAEDCALLGGADGIAVDRAGDAYVAVLSRSLIVRVRATGALEVLATAADGLDNPASLTFGSGAEDVDTLYITNFAFVSAMGGGTARPGVVKLAVHVSLPKPGPKK